MISKEIIIDIYQFLQGFNPNILILKMTKPYMKKFHFLKIQIIVKICIKNINKVTKKRGLF